MSQGDSSSSSSVSRSAGEALERAVLARVLVQRRDVEADAVVNPAGRRRRPRSPSRPSRGAPSRRRRRRCRIPGRRTRAPARFQPSRAQARSITITTPAPVASLRKTEPPIETGLPVTISGHGVALLHRVGVHHPGHRLLVRGDVGGRDVDPRADERREIGGEPAREALELVARERARVAADAALGAAVRQPQERALPGHPHRERGALAEVDGRRRSGRRPSSARAPTSAARDRPGRSERRRRPCGPAGVRITARSG